MACVNLGGFGLVGLSGAVAEQKLLGQENEGS